MQLSNHDQPASQPRYPHIELSLVGKDGNVFSIVGRARLAMRAANIPDEDIQAFQAEVFSGDYDQAIRTCLRWFSCD